MTCGRRCTFLMLAGMSLEAFDAEALTRGTDMLGVCTSALPLPCMSSDSYCRSGIGAGLSPSCILKAKRVCTNLFHGMRIICNSMFKGV